MSSHFYRLLGFSGSSQRSRHLETRGASALSLALVSVVGLSGLSDTHFHGGLVAVLTGTVLWEFIKRMDQGLPLMQVTALVAVFQWLVGPWLTYNIDFFYSTYDMRVDSMEYFSYALPGTSAFVLGLLLVGVSVRQKSLLAAVDCSKFVEIGFLLTFAALVAGFLSRFVPASVVFIFSLISQLRYIAALYFLFSANRLKYLYAVVAISQLFTGSAATGMFHDLLLWMGILICYWYATAKRKIWFTLLLITVGSLATFTIQGVKQSYRDKVWNGQDGSILTEIQDFWVNPEMAFSESTLAGGIVRINQGWIIAAIMSHVPQSEPYAEGETLSDALVAAIMPRLLFEGKVSAGGQRNFNRFTGLPISGDTSMGLSLLGEAYANFGPRLSLFLMFFLGAGLAFCHGLFLTFSLRHPTFYFWIPLIFCQTIKAETDLVTVLNYVAKAPVVAVGLYWLICVKLFHFVPGVDSTTKDKGRPMDESLLYRRAVPAEATVKGKG